MMDSMTNDELDDKKELNDTRIVRIARGSGTRPEEVVFLLEEYKKFSSMVKKMGKMNLTGGKGDMNMLNRNPKQLMQQMSKAIDPKLLQ